MFIAMESGRKAVDYESISAIQFFMFAMFFVACVCFWKFTAARYDAWWWRRFDRKHPGFRR